MVVREVFSVDRPALAATLALPKAQRRSALMDDVEVALARVEKYVFRRSCWRPVQRRLDDIVRSGGSAASTIEAALVERVAAEHDVIEFGFPVRQLIKWACRHKRYGLLDMVCDPERVTHGDIGGHKVKAARGYYLARFGHVNKLPRHPTTIAYYDAAVVKGAIRSRDRAVCQRLRKRGYKFDTVEAVRAAVKVGDSDVLSWLEVPDKGVTEVLFSMVRDDPTVDMTLFARWVTPAVFYALCHRGWWGYVHHFAPRMSDNISTAILHRTGRLHLLLPNPLLSPVDFPELIAQVDAQAAASVTAHEEEQPK
jgi:hypothetical protein